MIDTNAYDPFCCKYQKEQQNRFHFQSRRTIMKLEGLPFYLSILVFFLSQQFTLAKILQSKYNYSQEVYSIQFSPNGQFIAFGNRDRTVQLSDSNGKNVIILKGHDDAVLSVRFNTDGSLLASSDSQGVIIVWNVKTAKKINSFRGSPNRIHDIFFHPSEQYLAGISDDNKVYMWDPITGKPLETLVGEKDAVYLSLSMSSNGKLLATGTMDGKIHLWDITKNKLLACLKGHSKSVHSLAFSPDSKTFASAGGDKHVILWDSATQKNLAILHGHHDQVTTVAFHPNGLGFASGSLDKQVIIWDVRTKKEHTSLVGHAGSVYQLSYSPTGTELATAGGNYRPKSFGEVFLWHFTPDKP
jgi:WD40 repeat protein